jgi:cob(I)alamin adenosyltransferase
MVNQEIFVDALVIKYLNRLSDYLFVLARFIGHILNAEEIAWKPRI